MIKGLLLFALLLAGCAVSAEKKGDILTLRGFGAKKATWPEGYSIEKDEPFSVPKTIGNK